MSDSPLNRSAEALWLLKEISKLHMYILYFWFKCFWGLYRSFIFCWNNFLLSLYIFPFQQQSEFCFAVLTPPKNQKLGRDSSYLTLKLVDSDEDLVPHCKFQQRATQHLEVFRVAIGWWSILGRDDWGASVCDFYSGLIFFQPCIFRKVLGWLLHFSKLWSWQYTLHMWYICARTIYKGEIPTVMFLCWLIDWWALQTEMLHHFHKNKIWWLWVFWTMLIRHMTINGHCCQFLPIKYNMAWNPIDSGQNKNLRQLLYSKNVTVSIEKWPQNFILPL